MIKTIKRISLVSLLSFALVFAFAQSANAALTVGALTIASDGALTLTGAVGSAVSLGTTATTGTIAIGSASTTGGITIGGTSMTTGGTTIYGGTGTGAITMTPGTAGTIVIGKTDGTGAITLGSSSGTQTVNVGTGTGATTVNIATAGAAGSAVKIGSANGGLQYFEQIEFPVADDTLTVTESGKVFYMSAVPINLTLPDVSTAAGVHYRFIIPADLGSSIVHSKIKTGNSLENVIEGAVNVNSTLVACSAEDTITFVTSAQLPGDFVEVRSDGYKWFVTGQAVTTGAITCTQAD